MRKGSHNQKGHGVLFKERGEKGRRLEAEKDILLQAAISLNETFEASEIMRRLLSYAMELTGATSGVFGVFKKDRLIATEHNIEGTLSPIYYEFPAGYGVPGWVIENRKPYTSNNIEEDPYVIPEICKALGVYNLADIPIISRSGELLGCFEIHNTKDKRPFDEQDVEVLQKLASLATLALENSNLWEDVKEIESEVELRVELGKIISDISTEFISLEARQVDDGIERALKTVAEFLRVDRSYVFLFSEDGTKMSSIYEWRRKDIKVWPTKYRLWDISIDKFPWLIERIKRFEAVVVPRVEDMPPEAINFKKDCLSDSTQSLICVPMVCKGFLIGLVGFDSILFKNDWPEDIVSLVRIVGEIFANAINSKRSEEALIISETRFRQLFDNMSSGVAVYEAVDDGADFVFKNINKAGARITKFKREDLIGTRITETFPGMVKMGLVEAFKKVWQSGKNLHYPTAQYQDQRLSAWFENNIYKLPSGEIVAIFTDRTDEKLAQDALDLQRYYLQKAQEIAKVGAWSLNIKTDEITWTDEAYRIFGVPLGSEVTYEDFLEYVHPDDRQYVDLRWKAALDKEPFDIEHRILIEGDVKWVRGRAELQCDDQGKVSRAIGAVQDITERKCAEATLRESEERFRTLVSNIPGVSYRCAFDEHWTVKFISSEIETLSGYPATDFVENAVRSFASIIHPEDKQMVYDSIERSVDGKEPFTVEYRIVVADGEIRWVFEKGQGVFDADGKLLYLDGVFVDITERKQAEEALRVSEEQYKLLFESANDGILILDEDAKFTDCNPKICEKLRCSREQIIGETPFRFSPELQSDGRNSKEKAIEKVNKVLQGEPQFFEWKHIAYDGIPIDVEISLNRLELRGKACVQAIWRDITERKQAEEALRQSEEQYKLLFESANDGITLLEEDGKFINCNPKVCEMLGCSSEQIIGETPFRFSPELQPDGRNSKEKAFEKINKALQGKPLSFEWKHARYDGTPIDVEISLNRLELRGKACLQAIWRDITERKQAEEALRKSEEKYRRLVETMNEGLGTCDENNIFTYVNDKFCEILGYQREEILDHCLLEFVHDDYKDKLKKVIVDLMSKEIESVEMGWKGKDGTVRYTIAAPTALFDGEGNFAGSVGILTDITENKHEQLHNALFTQVLEVLNTEYSAEKMIQEVVGLLKENSDFEEVGICLRQGGNCRYSMMKGPNNEFMQFDEYPCACVQDDSQSGGLRKRALLGYIRDKVYDGQANADLDFFTEGDSFYTNSVTRLLDEQVIKDMEPSVDVFYDESGYESAAIFPMRFGQKTVGVMQLCDTRPDRLKVKVVHFFERITVSIGIGLARATAKEEIRLLNADLEKRVIDRTRKLAMSNVKLLKEVVDRRRLEKELLTITESERNRIGQELHDSLGQQLTGIAFMTKALEQKLSATSLPGAEDAGEIATLINTSITQARTLAKGLHPMELDASGFISAMEELAEGTELVFWHTL